VSVSTVALTERKLDTPGQATAKEPQRRIERRARHRAKIAAKVYVRSTDPTAERFEEVCESVDVSRDGLLITARHRGFANGQIIDVTFPYTDFPGAHNQARRAQVTRVTPRPHGRVAVAVHFLAAKANRKAGSVQSVAPHPVVGVTTKQTVERLKQCIVLAFEPEGHTAEMMSATLAQDGYTVVIVATAKAALDFLSTTVPEVFVAEGEAGDVSGHDLCRIIRQNERLAHVPVILLTRSAEPSDYSVRDNLGAVVCVAKPFRPERLQQVVRLLAPPPSMRSVYGARLPANASIDRTLR
jgi:CheY-like chemotaxis protein